MKPTVVIIGRDIIADVAMFSAGQAPPVLTWSCWSRIWRHR